MLGQGLVAIQVSLVIAALWLGYGMGSTLIQGSDTPDIALPPLEAQEREALTLEAYRVITTRDLFRTAKLPEPVAPPEVKIGKSAFAVRLIGTAASPDEVDESVAILESKVSGNKMVVRVGDPLFGATVNAIDRSRVVVMNKGKLEEIVPPQAPTPGGPKASPKRPTRQRIGSLASAARNRRAGARRKPKPPAIPTVKKSPPKKPVAEGLLGRGGLLSQARLVRLPAEEGSPGAYSITRLRKGGSAEKAGFQNGDVLISLNGVQLLDAASTLQQIREVNLSTGIQVVVDRDGERVMIELGPEDL